jgi:hypothetical protein
MTEAVAWDHGDDRAVGPLLTLSEAALVLGRAPESVRTMIRRRKLTAMKGNDGRWLVAVPLELRRQPGQSENRSVDGSPAENGRPVREKASDLDRVGDSLADRLKELEAVTVDLRLEADHWRDRAEQESIGRAKAEGKLEVIEREVGVLRELVVELRKAEARRIEPSLPKEAAPVVTPQSRRSWWKRLTGRWDRP